MELVWKVIAALTATIIIAYNVRTIKKQRMLERVYDDSAGAEELWPSVVFSRVKVGVTLIASVVLVYFLARFILR